VCSLFEASRSWENSSVIKSTQNINANDNIEALIAEAESIKDNADATLAKFATADEAVLV